MRTKVSKTKHLPRSVPKGLPHSVAKKDQAEASSRHIDESRSCLACFKQGIYRYSKTGFCTKCRHKMPWEAKKSGTLAVWAILQRYSNFVIDWLGLEHAAHLMQVSVEAAQLMSLGQVAFACDSVDGEHRPSSAAHMALNALPPGIVALLFERYPEFCLLDPALAELVRPWRRPLEAELARESPIERRRRLNRAAQRADVVCHVPEPTAPLDHAAAQNAYGCTDLAGRSRSEIPMRMCVALWCLGLGARPITRIARAARMHTSKSAVGRMCKQAEQPFAGSQAVKGSDLALEIKKRPLPPLPPDERKRRRDKMKQC